MRNYKWVKVRIIETEYMVTWYDPEKKQLNMTPEKDMPEGVKEVDRTIVSQKLKTYRMSREVFVNNAELMKEEILHENQDYASVKKDKR